jgi:hypothetical protein
VTEKVTFLVVNHQQSALSKNPAQRQEDRVIWPSGDRLASLAEAMPSTRRPLIELGRGDKCDESDKRFDRDRSTPLRSPRDDNSEAIARDDTYRSPDYQLAR